jgi:hypothetical protein
MVNPSRLPELLTQSQLTFQHRLGALTEHHASVLGALRAVSINAADPCPGDAEKAIHGVVVGHDERDLFGGAPLFRVVFAQRRNMRRPDYTATVDSELAISTYRHSALASCICLGVLQSGANKRGLATKMHAH